MLSKKYLAVEVVLLIALIISGIYGASIHIKSGIRKNGGDITIENYAEYLNVECRITSYSNVDYYTPYRVSFRCTDSAMRITDLAIKYSIEAEYSDFGSYSAQIELIEGTTAETVEGKVHFDIPASVYPTIFPDLYPKVTVTEVSGHYSYAF
jgi:hypothetical protein